MNNFLLDSLSKAFNSYLKLDPESSHRLAKLQGKVISIELLPLGLHFQCLFTDEGVSIRKQEYLVMSDVTISGTPLQMLGVMLNKTERQRFFADDVKIEGDAELGHEVIKLFDDLTIDWEDYLAKIVGDIPAHHVSQFMRSIGKNLRQKEQSLTQHIQEFIHEEAKWLPSSEALNDFFHDIDHLRMNADRLEAKVKYLQSLYEESNDEKE